MAKELPYFKFYISEWLMGDITLQSQTAQGVFINVCAYYWQRGCDTTLANVKQRLSAHITDVETLVQVGIIKHDSTTDKISINFLNEQYLELLDLHQKRSESGRKGGEASVKQRSGNAQPSIKHLDKDKDKDINIRFANFISWFNTKTKRNFKGIEKIKKSFGARLKDGYTPHQFEVALNNMLADTYHIETEFKYITPEFLLRQDKLDKFLNMGEKKEFVEKKETVSAAEFYGYKLPE